MQKMNRGRRKKAKKRIPTPLGWPARAIGLALRSVPRRHASAYLALVRRLGRMLTKNATELDNTDLGNETLEAVMQDI